MNKTGLQPVLRPVEQVYYFGGWVEGVNCKVPIKALVTDKHIGLAAAPDANLRSAPFQSS